MPKGFPIEEGHIMMFARALGDPNPIYTDEDHAKTTEVGHVIAPPTFVQSSAHFRDARRAAGGSGAQRAESGQASSGEGAAEQGSRAGGRGGGGTGLHAEQHYTYHRHPKPGDVLTATSHRGESWEKEGRRAGKLVFTETITEYRDQNGELVVTARSVGVRTERPVERG